MESSPSWAIHSSGSTHSRYLFGIFRVTKLRIVDRIPSEARVPIREIDAPPTEEPNACAASWAYTEVKCSTS